MAASSARTAGTSDREIITSRLFDAPRETVFEAWTRAEHLSKWWGPNGFSTTTHAFDFRPGGAWVLTMHGPDGTAFENRVVYDEIVRPERIVFTHHPAGFQTSVTFTEETGKTRVVLHHVFATADDRNTVVEKFRADEGAAQTLARLAEVVASGQVPPVLVLSRTFDAPRRLVFEAWTKAEHVARWFTPRPLTTSECVVDFRPGGRFRVVMRMPDGAEHPMEGTFTEAVPPERLGFAGVLNDGNRIITTVTFAEDAGKTTLTVRQTYSFRSAATGGAVQGWTTTLDQLGEHIAQ